MKLARFRRDERDAIGLVADAVFDISAAIPGLPADMVELLEASDHWFDRIAQACDHAPSYELTEVELLAPIPRPRKVLGIGLNYPAHAAEGGANVPEVQYWFNKQNSCINGPYAPVHMPRVSTKLDYEGELVVVIGHRGRHVSRDRALHQPASFSILSSVPIFRSCAPLCHFSSYVVVTWSWFQSSG